MNIFFIYVHAVHLLVIVGSCLKDFFIASLGSDLFHTLEFHQPLVEVV